MDKLFIYYHNPRCSKSQEGLNIVEKNNINAKIKLYLSEEITFEELQDIINKLDIDPIDLVRKKEDIIKKEKLDLKSM